MAEVVTSPKEIYLGTTRFPIKGGVRPHLVSILPGKVTIGEYSLSDELVASSWVISDQRGGILIEEMEEKIHQDRCWWSTCNLGFRGHIILPVLATDCGSGGLSGEDCYILFELDGVVYACFDEHLRSFDNGNDDFNDEEETFSANPTDVLVYKNAAIVAFNDDTNIQQKNLPSLDKFIDNPYFKEWSGGYPVDWGFDIPSDGAVDQNTDTEFTHKGKFSVKLTAGATVSTYMRQKLPFSTALRGKTVRVTVYGEASAAENGTEINIKIDDGVGGTDVHFSTSFAQQIVEHLMAATATSLMLEFQASAGETLHVDDIEITIIDFKEGWDFGTGTDDSIECPSLTTTDTLRLGVAFVFINDDEAVGAFTGESGGDWTEAVAEFTTGAGLDGCVQLQIATLATATTISGGTHTIAGGADPWGVSVFALIPVTPAVQVTYVSAGAGSGVGGNVEPAYPASLQSGDLIILQVTVRNTSDVPTTPIGFTLLHAPESTGTGKQWLYYIFSDGTETGTLTVTTNSTDCCIGRMYAFRNVATSTFTGWTDMEQEGKYLTSLGDTIYMVDTDGKFYTSKVGIEYAEKCQIPEEFSVVNSLFIYRDVYGNSAVYVGTDIGNFIYDSTNERLLRTELSLPHHPMGAVNPAHWREALYVPAGLDVLKYIAQATATITSVGLDKNAGLPAEYQGEITALIKGYNDVYALVDSTYGSGTVYSSLMAYDGLGWQCKWLSGTAGKAIKCALITGAYDEYRLFWGADNKVYHITLERNLRNPLKLSTYTFESSGVHITPWFDAGWIGDKLALTLSLFCKDTTADETVQVSYRTDRATENIGSVGTEWASLGTVVLAGDGVETEYEFASGIGEVYQSIQFRLDLTTTDPDVSPDVQWVKLKYFKLLETKWGWATRIDCSGEYKGNTSAQLTAALKTLIATQTLAEFTFRDESGGSHTYYVRIANASGAEETGTDWTGQFDIALVEP